jgi:hypothetical protein
MLATAHSRHYKTTHYNPIRKNLHYVVDKTLQRTSIDPIDITLGGEIFEVEIKHLAQVRQSKCQKIELLLFVGHESTH